MLNVGVRPAELILRARQKFEAAGGVVIENSPLERVGVRRDAAVATTRDGETVMPAAAAVVEVVVVGVGGGDIPPPTLSRGSAGERAAYPRLHGPAIADRRADPKRRGARRRVRGK